MLTSVQLNFTKYPIISELFITVYERVVRLLLINGVNQIVVFNANSGDYHPARHVMMLEIRVQCLPVDLLDVLFWTDLGQA